MSNRIRQISYPGAADGLIAVVITVGFTAYLEDYALRALNRIGATG